jgi:hypothetical protein
MRRLSALVLLVLLAPLLLSTAALAAETPPEGAVGTCPPGFHLHPAGDHDDGHTGEHKHVGDSTDHNVDGWICVKHAGPDGRIHIHVDNHLPLGE